MKICSWLGGVGAVNAQPNWQEDLQIFEIMQATLMAGYLGSMLDSLH